MDGNVEEILAPLRLAVKEQVTIIYLTLSADKNKLCLFRVRYDFIASDTVTHSLIAHQANRLTDRLLTKLSMNENSHCLLANC